MPITNENQVHCWHFKPLYIQNRTLQMSVNINLHTITRDKELYIDII